MHEELINKLEVPKIAELTATKKGLIWVCMYLWNERQCCLLAGQFLMQSQLKSKFQLTL